MSLKEFDISFEDTSVHCWEGGSGFPILLMHGSGAGAATMGNWKRVIEPLSRKYHVLAADLVGFGQSGRKKEKPYFDMAMWMRQGRALLSRLEGDAGIIGHSISGALSLMIAAREPRVKKVMTTGTMGISFPCVPGSRLWRYPESRDAVRQSTQVTVFDKSLIDEAELDSRWKVLSAPGYREYWESMFDKEKQHYIDAAAVSAEDLAKVKAQARVLMMHGRQDVNFPPADTCLPLSRSLHADVWIVDDCAHSVALEHPQKFLAGADLLFGPTPAR